MKKKSFTLVEIMIVVAIIAILAAIAVPSLSQNRETAMEQTKKANIKLVNGAIANFLSKNYQAALGTVDSADITPFLIDPDTGKAPTTAGDLSFMDVGGQTITLSSGVPSYN